MGEVTNTLTVYLASRKEDVDIDVNCEYEVLNNGIGSYECWGPPSNDKGQNYAVIESCEWDKFGFTPDERADIESAIEKAKKEWEGEIDTRIDYGDPPDKDED